MDVIVPVWRHGREALPTAKSLRAAAIKAGDAVTVRVTMAVSAACMQTLPPELAKLAKIVPCTGTGRGEVLAAGFRAADGDIVGLLDAGDLIDDGWLRSARQLVPGRVLRPQTIVTFGARTGILTQPAVAGIDSQLTDLAHRDLWASPFLARRDDVTRALGLIRADWSDVAVSAAFAVARLDQAAVTGSVAFVRRWSEARPFVHEGPVLDRVPLLCSPELAHTARVPVAPARRAVWLRKWAARAYSLVRPWRDLICGAHLRVRRLVGRTTGLAPDLHAAWARANALEALVPFPRPDVAEWVEQWGAPDTRTAGEIGAYWSIVGGLGERVDYLYFVPWLRTGGADSVVLQYVRSVREADPDGKIAVVTTEPVPSTRLGELGSSVATVELEPLLAAGVHRDAFVGWIVPQLIAQYHPRTVHAFNSTVAFDVIERYGDKLGRESGLFLSTFAIDRSKDGEALSVLLLRSPGFLDNVSRVLVDSERFVDRVVDELGYEREKFAVLRSVVPISQSDTVVLPRAPLRVLWAGRFDLPKRLDILASIAEAARARNMPVEFHFYGLEVMGDADLAATIARLNAAGAVRHPPFAAFGDLPVEQFGAYLLTSEWEGVPLTLLEAMSTGIPAVAPLVGGVGEVLTPRTGYPVSHFDDVDAYLDCLQIILDDPGDASRRAARARELMEASFSVAAFSECLRNLGDYLRET
ncbi:glycosyltransferase [Microbacterium aurum]